MCNYLTPYDRQEFSANKNNAFIILEKNESIVTLTPTNKKICKCLPLSNCNPMTRKRDHDSFCF